MAVAVAVGSAIATGLATGALAATSTTENRFTADLRPLVLKAPYKRRTPVGLLYSPELLQRLIAKQPPGHVVSSRLADAARLHTPVVVMWSLRPWRDTGDQSLRPYAIEVDQRIATGSKVPIQPLWVDQQAADLRALDPQTAFLEVGAVAAFPAGALTDSASVIVYTVSRTDPRGLVREQIFGRLR
jgi:hypothetical protein